MLLKRRRLFAARFSGVHRISQAARCAATHPWLHTPRMQHAPRMQLDCDLCALVRVPARMAAAGVVAGMAAVGVPAVAAGIAGGVPGVPVPRTG